jgi:hypothetical protein
MRQATIYYQDIPAGTLTETDEGEYRFIFHEAYIRNYPDQFPTFTMLTHRISMKNAALIFSERAPSRRCPTTWKKWPS